MLKEDSDSSNISRIKKIEEDIDIENSSIEDDKINEKFEISNLTKIMNETSFTSIIKDVNNFNELDEIDKSKDYLKIDNYIGEFIQENNISIIKGFISENFSNRLYYSKILIKNMKHKSNILIVHGYGNSNNFIEMACNFAKEGYVVHLYDIRGFGYSGGLKFNCTLKENFTDLIMTWKLIKNSLPLFILSYDFSCNLIMNFLILNNINWAGVIYISPLIIPNYFYGTLLKNLKRNIIIFLSKIIDDLLICNFYNYGHLAKNIKILKNENKLNIPHFGIKFISFILESGEFINKYSHHLISPTLLIQGKKNNISNFNLIMNIYNKISSSDKIAKLLKNGYHEIYKDYENEEITKEIIKWLNKRYKKSKPLNLNQLKKINYNQNSIKFKKILKIVLIILYFRILLYLKNTQYFKNNKTYLIFYPIYFSYKFLIAYSKIIKNIFLQFFGEIKKEFVKNL